MARLYRCTHMDIEFMAKVYYSRKHGCWVVETPFEKFYLASMDKAMQIISSFDKCEEVEQ